jgi:hypothetical protein
MTRKRILLGIPVIALVLTMAALGACASSAYTSIDPVMPNQNVVIYFRGSADLNTGSIWDGEKPIGDYNEKGLPMVPIFVYETTPGEHYFIAHASNWVTMRVNLEANKRYFIGISSVPSPPFTTFIAMYPMDAADLEEAIASRWSDTLAFTDEWRAEFAQGKLLAEVKENLQDAKGKSMEVSMTGKDGI